MSTEECFPGFWAARNVYQIGDLDCEGHPLVDVKPHGAVFGTFPALITYLWDGLIDPEKKWGAGGKMVRFFPYRQPADETNDKANGEAREFPPELVARMHREVMDDVKSGFWFTRPKLCPQPEDVIAAGMGMLGTDDPILAGEVARRVFEALEDESSDESSDEFDELHEWADMVNEPDGEEVDTEEDKAAALQFCMNKVNKCWYDGARLTMVDMAARLWAERPSGGGGVIIDNNNKTEPQ
jgi:hypothetical protein